MKIGLDKRIQRWISNFAVPDSAFGLGDQCCTKKLCCTPRHYCCVRISMSCCPKT